MIGKIGVFTGAALLALASVTVAQGNTAARAPFSFRDWHVNDPYRADDPRIARCVDIAAGTACVFRDNRIAGVEARQIGAAFGRQGLFALEAKFPSQQSDVVEAALNDRYGPPCETRTERPINALGNRFERRVRVWCFSDGRATLNSITDVITEASFKFATHDAARQMSVQDF